MTGALLLVRHGETDWNREGRYQGHADPPLNAAGRAQARRLAGALAGLELAAIYSSDRQRALATAAPLAAGRGLPVEPDPRWRELDFGAWEGQRAADLMAADPAAWQAWHADPLRVAPPGGETVPRLWRRVRAALGAIAARHRGGTVAVVTHGGPLRLLLARLATGALHPPLPLAIPPGGWLLVTAPALAGGIGPAPAEDSWPEG